MNSAYDFLNKEWTQKLLKQEEKLLKWEKLLKQEKLIF
jgi:hypothetical protein